MTTIGTLNPWPGVFRLGWREIQRFFRQRNRVIGAIGTPLLFWILFGAGFDRSFRMMESSTSEPAFREYYLPGSVLLMVLFTAIFTTISVIEDRREGFLQSVLVSPLPKWAMVLGKVWGGATIALIQGIIFLLLAFCFGQQLDFTQLPQIIVLLFVSAAALTSLGFIFAWNLDSTQGFHAIMNLVLMPMWLLSGAFFPAPMLTIESTASEQIIHWCMRLNPLSYPVAALRQHMYGVVVWQNFWIPTLTTAWLVTLMFLIVSFIAACGACQRRHSGDWLS